MRVGRVVDVRWTNTFHRFAGRSHRMSHRCSKRFGFMSKVSMRIRLHSPTRSAGWSRARQSSLHVSLHSHFSQIYFCILRFDLFFIFPLEYKQTRRLSEDPMTVVTTFVGDLQTDAQRTTVGQTTIFGDRTLKDVRTDWEDETLDRSYSNSIQLPKFRPQCHQRWTLAEPNDPAFVHHLRQFVAKTTPTRTGVTEQIEIIAQRAETVRPCFRVFPVQMWTIVICRRWFDQRRRMSRLLLNDHRCLRGCSNAFRLSLLVIIIFSLLKQFQHSPDGETSRDKALLFPSMTETEASPNWRHLFLLGNCSK